ncbi:MAG: PKD domain-containing protein [Methanoregulaceae archaeon]|jgi:PKD repeat protein
MMKHDRMITITAILAVLLMVGCATAAQFTFQDVQIDSVGGTATAELRMDIAPAEGFAGYIIQLDAADPSIARVTSVTYNPALEGMTNTDPSPPFTSGKIAWVDVNDLLEAPGGETDVLLATLTFTSLAPGSTTWDATMLMITDDNGDDMIPVSSITSPTVDVYDEPEAAFSADTTTPGVGETVTFSDESTGNVVSWDWDFGDGSSHSPLQNPTHVYATAGTYTVSLTVTNPAGTDTETKTGFIEAKSLAAGFSVTATNGVAPITVGFTDASVGSPTSWVWEYKNYNDATWTEFGAGAQNPTGIVFNEAGTYDIRLTVSNGVDTDTVARTHVFAAANAAEPLALVRSGSVSGGLYVESPHTYATGVTEVTHTFTLPSFTGIEWAKLYVNTYSGSAAGTHGLTSTVQFNGNTLGVETMDIASTITGASFPLNDHVTKVYSDYEAQYDVTSLITSTSPSVHVRGEAISGLTFDGRIKGITLVVAYNDGDGDNVEYWVNHGQHWIPATTGYGSTTFDASGIASGWASAASSIRFHSSSDAAYEFNTVTKASGTSPDTGGLLNTWDVTDELVAGTNTLEFTKSTSYSYKATIATLTARYLAPPVADFVADKTTASTTDVIQFTDQSAGEIAEWAWDFDNNGTIDSTDQHPTWTYATEGLKTVSLTVTNAGGSDTRTRTDYINVVDSFISFVPATQTFRPSESVTYDIVMNKAPQGLAGYNVVVSLVNGSVADITAVTYPAWATMPPTSVLPGDSIRIGGVDSGQAIAPGAADVVLATLTVRGTVEGSTAIHLSDLTMDGDGGVVLTPTLVDGEAVVGAFSGPIAAFNATPTSGLAPLDVTFTDQSTGDITTWQWDFDNNGVIDSTLQHPSHTYPAAGTYTVKLTVTGPGGSDTEIKTGFITAAMDPPQAAFNATPTTGNLPLAVTFTDESSGTITSWAWDFDNDGITDSVLQNPTKTYTTAGTYTVKLTVTGPGGSDSETKTGLITVTYPAPVAEFIANPTSGTAPLTVAFSDQSTGTVTSWAWDFGDGGNSTDQNPSHTFAAGTHTVSLTMTGPGGSATRTRAGYITATGLTADFIADQVTGTASTTVPFNVTFTDESTGYPAGPDTWSWDFGNGETSTVRNPPTVHYYGRPQQFTVTLTVTKGTDSDAETKFQFITITPYLEAFPGYANLPTDLDGDGRYEDINGNGRLDYDDVVAFFHNLIWIRNNPDVDVENYDFNFNGDIDYDDVVTLNDMVLYR